MIQALQNRRILLIISGGIAAYKSLDLIRRLREAGARVRCVVTRGGTQFVTPLSVAALSEEPVFTDLWSLTDEQQMGHIRLSRECDLIVIAPASANMIAQMAQGLANDLATTVLLATDKPVMIAPAMNGMMWSHAATKANIATLRQRGIAMVGPAVGMMACGEQGEGRMSEVSDIMAAITAHFAVPGVLNGKRALVTAGPTYEPLDPVRFLGNRSSGKQGYAIAKALAAQGADVTLVSGPSPLPDPVGIKTIRVETAQDMLAACTHALPADIAICTAAVADWRPATVADDKLKKSNTEPHISLIENPDILATLSTAGHNRPRLVIGFAAETSDMAAHALDKIKRKGCDWLIANDVSHGKGFGTDDNEVTLLRRATNGDVESIHWPLQSKEQIAQQLVDEVATFFQTA